MKVLINEDSNEGSDTCDQESIADRNAVELTDANKDYISTKKIRRKKTDKEQLTLKTGKVPLRNIPPNMCISLLSRVHNIIGEESVLLCNRLYKRVLQSISTFHRLLT